MLFPPQLFNFFVLLDVKSWVSEKMLIEAQTKDRYGRTVGVVFLDNQNVNNELVRQSMAWVYKKYTDNKILDELEAQAKNRRIGLWADENPIAPWDWRRGKR